MSDAVNQDFSAVLFGDCTGNWQPSASGARAALLSQSSSAAMVRLGVVHRGRGGGVRFPVLVESAEPFHALDMRITYDPAHLRLLAARPVNAARDALLQYNSTIPGVAMIALAGAEPITSGGGPILVLDFERRQPRWAAPPHIHTASIDGRSAEVIDAE